MELDLNKVIIALIIVFMPIILREVVNLYQSLRRFHPEVSNALDIAAEFGVLAAQTLKENGFFKDAEDAEDAEYIEYIESIGIQAEKYAIASANEFLKIHNVKIDAALIADAVRVAWQRYKMER